jgi:hypothetical protein
MAVYFIRPGRANQIDKSRESYCHDNGVISIGWNQVDDLSNVSSYNEIKARLIPIYENTEKVKAVPNYASQLWMFIDKIELGDYILMPLLEKKGYISIGKMTGPYKHQPDDPVNHHVRAVEWIKVIERSLFNEDIIRGPFASRKTVCSFVNINEAEFRIKKIIEKGADPFFGIKNIGGGENGEGFGDGDEFVYEAQLREYISNNVEIIEKGLSLYEDSDGKNGVEFPAGTWNIDILATDLQNNYVIIELKKSRTSDKVFGQLARYMGWVKTNLCRENQEVRGVIIGGTITDELKYAAKLNNNIKLMEYTLSISLKQVNQ